MVTLNASEECVVREVAPRLVFRTELPTTSFRAMRRARANLEPLHEFVRLRSRGAFVLAIRPNGCVWCLSVRVAGGPVPQLAHPSTWLRAARSAARRNGLPW